MTPEAKQLLGEKIEQLKIYPDEHDIAINARDLRAFGLEVPEHIPGGTPVFLKVKDLRQLAEVSDVEPIVEDCGCPGKE
jgi:hypothetical protein